MPEVDRLEIAIQAEATRASAELDKLIGKLNILSGALSSVDGNGLTQLSSGVTQLSVAMQMVGNVKTASFTRLSSNIQKLGNINTGNMQSIASSINTFASSINTINATTDNVQQISTIINSVSKFGSVSMQRAATNLPLLANALKSFMVTLATAPNVSSNIINMTNAMANLASFGSKYNATINSMSRAANTISKANNSIVSSGRGMSRSITSEFTRMLASVYTVKQALDLVGNSIEESMDFTETINLFQTSFKKIGMEAAQESGLEWGSEAANQFAIGFINEAQSFNDMLVDSLSLDPDTLMNYQAVFAQMANAFGLTNESVMNLSKSFTMLGLDISSLFNTGIEEAMVKLRAGLAGESEPLRTLGIDITEASLKLTALNYGITDNVSKMSQAAKTQLRWLTIMDQAEVAFGDMAKTIDSPANQLRVLEQQWNNLTRSIGNLFLPIISSVLPYVNALVIVLRRLIDTLATAVGFELPDYSDSDIYQDITGGIVNGNTNITDSANDATKANEKLKKSLRGWDELNNISNSASRNSTGTGSGGSGYPGLDDAINDKTNSYMAKFNEELDKMKNKAEELANMIQPKIEGFLRFLDKISPALAGIAAAFVTYKIIGWFTDLAKWIGALSLSPAGVIAIAIGALATLVVAFHKYYDGLVEKDLAKRFGNITLSLEEIKEIAGQLTTNKYTIKIDAYVTEKAKLSELQKNIETDLATLNKLNWKISVGLGLTPEEQVTYKRTIESFISNTEAYIQQQRYVVDLAIDAVVQDDGKFNTEMKALVNEYFAGSQGEMERLGKQLREKMDSALADGIIDESEQNTINNLIKEMNEITSQVSNAEFKAKLQMITVDGQLTADSFKKLTEEIQSAIDEKLSSEQEAYYTALTYINVAYQAKLDKESGIKEKAKLQNEWDADVKKLSQNFSKTKANITLDGMTFSLNTLTQNYKTEIEKASKNFASSTKEVIDPALSSTLENLDTKSSIGQLVFAMTENYKTALSQSGMSSAAQTGLNQMLKALEPSKKQLEKIYQDSLAAGTQVPDGVSEALTDVANLGALSGDMDSIAFLLGQKLSTDQTFLDLLKKSETAGKDLNDSLIAGLKSKIPDLRIQGDSLVFSLDDAIKTATNTSSTKNMPGYAKNVVDGLNKGISDNQNTSKPNVDAWTSGVNKWFTAKINKDLFEKYGSNVVSGLNSGVSNNSISSKDKMESWAKNVNKWFTDNSSTSQFKNYGENIVSGLNSGVSSNQSSSKNIFETWASKIKGWFTSAFDIHSPSRIAFGWAENIVKGFNNGISSMSDSSRDYMNSWVDSIGGVTANIGLGVNDSAIKGYLNGGFPNTADLFYANENGSSELVGRIGNRHSVVSNDQIVQSVSVGVSNAVADVLLPVLMNIGSSSNNINVILQGDANGLFKIVKSQNDEYIARTGKSAFQY